MQQDQTDKSKTHEFRFLGLLILLFCTILIPPYFTDIAVVNHLWRVIFSAVLVFALLSVVGTRKNMVWTGALLVPTFVTLWLSEYLENRVFDYLDNLSTIIYLLVVAWFLTRFVLKARLVTLNVIYASMCLYLMLALIWAAIYANLHIFYGDAFQFDTPELEMMASNSDSHTGLFTYFSFVTLSTLGYGDISPINRVAQAWVSVEAMIGQFYIAIIMARLVSLYTARESREFLDGK
jgi:hypothetical protein